MSQAGIFNPCMGNAFTARLATAAIHAGFCGYDYLQTDAVFAKFRQSPEFPAVLAEAKQCRDNFVAARAQRSSGEGSISLMLPDIPRRARRKDPLIAPHQQHPLQHPPR